MKIITAFAEILTPFTHTDALEMLCSIERAGRTCYKSEEKITSPSAARFVRDIVQVKHHESVIEHIAVTVKFVVDRGVSHELVRHRLASFAQESTRYCNYSKEKFGNEITVIAPFPDPDSNSQCWVAYHDWLFAMRACEETYFKLLGAGYSPQIARSVLPNALKTEVVMTANLREWRHIFKLRTSPAAHPQMREVMVPLCKQFAFILPEVFEDIVL